MKKQILTLAMIILALCTFAQNAGSLDLTFNGTGYVVTNVSTGDDWGRSVVIQPNGKIVVGGRSYDTQWKFSLVRYLTNGTLDPSFGTAGKVVTPMGVEGGAYSIARQSNGKIVLAGYYNNGTNYDFALARYDTTGALDLTFNGTGKLSTAFGSASDVAHVVAIQPDQKIIAAGYSSNGTNYDIAIARYNTNGALDAGFGTGGKVTISAGSYDDDVYGIAIQPNGKIILAGYSFNGATNQGVMIRFLPNGTLDNTFGSGGMMLTPNTSQWDTFLSIALQSNGKIIGSGYHTANGVNRNFAILRYDTTGVLDPSFAGNGIVTTDFSGNDDEAYGVVVQPNGQIVAAGYSINGTAKTFGLARYNSNGALDNTFGTAGLTSTNLGNPDAYGISVALQADGKIVVAGRANGSSNLDYAVARYFGSEITSVQTNDAENEISIYPNPADKTINVSFVQLNVNESVNAAIYDLQGRNILQNQLNSLSYEIDISDLSPGIYILKLDCRGKNMIRKFVKD
jgi:uncharacterized delta-60 repeat protein